MIYEIIIYDTVDNEAFEHHPAKNYVDAKLKARAILKTGWWQPGDKIKSLKDPIQPAKINGKVMDTFVVTNHNKIATDFYSLVVAYEK